MYRTRHMTSEKLKALVHAHRANANVFERLQYMTFQDCQDDTRSHVVVTENKKIVAAANLQTPENDTERLWILGVSVDRAHRGQKLSNRMLTRVFAYAAEHKKILEPSSFTEQGFRCLAPVMARLHEKHPDLLVRYGSYRTPLLDGHRPYRLEHGNGVHYQVVYRR